VVTLPSIVDGVAPVTMRYGMFLQATFDFMIVAGALFIAVKGINRVRNKDAAKPAAPPPQEVLLTEIRDLLKNK
jgi:large conductance mechanosensitive channel